MPVFGVALDHRHLQHLAGLRRDGQERRIGGAALGPQGRQDDVHHLVVDREHPQQRRVEHAGLVALGGGQELVLEAEAVEEAAQARVVVRGKARILVAEGVRHRRQRLADVRRQHVLVGHVVRHLPQAVHVVGEADQPRLALALGQHLEGVAHHGRARDLAEGADVRQAGGSVARLEDRRLVGAARELFQPLDEPARLLERPGARLLGGGDERGVERLCHGRGPYWPGRAASTPARLTDVPAPPRSPWSARATAARRWSRSRRSACRRGRRGTCGNSSAGHGRRPASRAPRDRRGGPAGP